MSVLEERVAVTLIHPFTKRIRVGSSATMIFFFTIYPAVVELRTVINQASLSEDSQKLRSSYMPCLYLSLQNGGVV